MQFPAAAFSEPAYYGGNSAEVENCVNAFFTHARVSPRELNFPKLPSTRRARARTRARGKLIRRRCQEDERWLECDGSVLAATSSNTCR
jgi:hypothetical protein